MSYLDGPRVAFVGRFFGDVPTINNRPENYPESSEPPTLLWNPGGGATFDFLDCRVVGGEGDAGAPMPPGDPARGLAVVGAADRSSAKLVDLDPHWQLSSEIWGLVVRLVDPVRGEELLSGSFRVAAFRDLWPRQIAKAEVNGQLSGGSFTSVLDDVVYGPGAAASPVLSALRESTQASRLSIVLNLFGYFYFHVDGSFGTGSMTGCIGPWRPGEPETFVAGRRIGRGLLYERPSPLPPVLLGPSVASLDRTASRLVLDLGNAYPIVDHDGRPASLVDLSSPGETVTALEVGALASEAVPANALLEPGAVRVLGTIDPSQAPSRAGVFSFPLDQASAELAAQHPLALLARRPSDARRVICRETAGGIYVRADDFVHRIDADATTTATLYAVRRGEPAPGVAVHLARHVRPTSPERPPFDYSKLTSVETGAAGTAEVTLTAQDPGQQRAQQRIDGVVETIGYAPWLTAAGSLNYNGTGLVESQDVIVAHVRDAYHAPGIPDWGRNIQPILEQYARLYPIMREHLVDLADPEAIQRWRAPMLLAMTRDIDDPNYMPVTRDLSQAKRAAIVRWLEALPAAAELPPAGKPGADQAPAEAIEAAAVVDADVLRFDAKSAAAEAAARQVMEQSTTGDADES